MKRPQIILDKIIFTFIVNELPYTVHWTHIGKDFVNGKEYPHVYKVYCNYGSGQHFTTSFQANKSNSLDFLISTIGNI